MVLSLTARLVPRIFPSSSAILLPFYINSTYFPHALALVKIFFVAVLQRISVFRRFLKVTPCLYSLCLEWFPLSTRVRPSTDVSGQHQSPRKPLLTQVRLSCPMFSHYSVSPALHLCTALLISI